MKALKQNVGVCVIAGSSCYLTMSSSTLFINRAVEHCPRLCLLGVLGKLTQTFTNDLHHSGHKLFCLPCRQYHNIHLAPHTPREVTALSRPEKHHLTLWICSLLFALRCNTADPQHTIPVFSFFNALAQPGAESAVVSSVPSQRYGKR